MNYKQIKLGIIGNDFVGQAVARGFGDKRII
jgi:hypothetical protein